MFIKELLGNIAKQLKPISETAQLDAQVLAAHILDVDRSWVLAHPEVVLSNRQLQELDDAAVRLESGEPLPYVLGHWEFYGHDFAVEPGVLIPRPETELLVDRAIQWLNDHPMCNSVIDVGTGTGCIAAALAIDIPEIKVVASDCSFNALCVAKRNFLNHSLESRVYPVRADLLGPFKLSMPSIPAFDLIVSNPPYISTVLLETLAVSRWEPAAALNGGANGMKLIQRLLKAAPDYLAPGGCLLMEIDALQGERVFSEAHRRFPNARVQIEKDLAGCDRMLVVERDY